MIELSTPETKWIKLIKWHYKETYPEALTYAEYMIPLFTEIYGWSPLEDNNYEDYLRCLFEKLVDVYELIKENDHELNTKTIFRSISKPIGNGKISSLIKPESNAVIYELGIIELVSSIRFVAVTNTNGIKRFNLDI